MHPQDGDPQAKADAGVDVAADRRRAGRREAVHPQLLRILRGQLDPQAPVGPEVGRPDQGSAGRELVSGAIITLALLLVGAMLRFVV